MQKRAKADLKLPYTIILTGMVSMEDYFYGLQDSDRHGNSAKYWFNPERIANVKTELAKAKKSRAKKAKENVAFWERSLPTHETERTLTLTGGYRYREFTFRRKQRYEIIQHYQGYDGKYHFAIETGGLILNFETTIQNFQHLFGVPRKSIQRRKEWVLRKKVEKKYKGQLFKVYSDAGWGDGSTIDYGLNIFEALKTYHRYQHYERTFKLSDYVSKHSYSKGIYINVISESQEMGTNIIDDDYTLQWERPDFDPGDI